MAGKLVRVNGRLVQLPEDNTPRDPTPKTIKWKGVPMLRAHSFLYAVSEGVEAITATPLITHNVTGMQGTGKTTLINSIAHATHKIAKMDHKLDFAVYHWGAAELKDPATALKKVNKDSIITFDDISFEHRDLTPKQLNEVLKIITRIRHRDGLAKDTRTVLIYTSHYTKSIPTLLRAGEFVWITSANSDIERENLRKMFGGYGDDISNFETMRRKTLYQKGEKRWGPAGKNPPKGQKPKPMYEFRNPFAPVLFFDTKPRLVLFPKREWMDAYCGICDTGITRKEYTESDISDMMQLIQDSYGTNTITGVKAWLSKHGEWSFSPKSGKVSRRLDKLFDEGVTVQHIKNWFDNYNKTKSDRRREAQS